MKKIFLILIILSSFVLAVNATETIQYKNLRNKTQIMYNQDFDSWSTSPWNFSGSGLKALESKVTLYALTVISPVWVV